MLKKEKPFQPSNRYKFRIFSFIIFSTFVLISMILYVIPSGQIDVNGKIVSYGHVSNQSGNHIVVVVELESGNKVTVSAPGGLEYKRDTRILLNETKSMLGIKKYYFKRILNERK
jgi:hypothetical protein